MRAVVVCFLAAVAVAEIVNEPWIDEEDIQEQFQEDPYGEHLRVKRCCVEEPRRVRRSEAYVRTPRQVHQYEVHEFTDDADPSLPPYEEMLASSAEHYHRVHPTPGSPKNARYLDPEVSPINVVEVPLSQPFMSKVTGQKLVQTAPVNQGYVQKVLQTAPVSQIHVAPGVQPAPVSPYLSRRLPGQGHEPVASDVLVSVPSRAEVPLHVASLPLIPLERLQADQSPAAAKHHQQKKGHSHAAGGGHNNVAKHQSEHGAKKSHGFNKDHYVNHGNRGHNTDEHHRKEYEEAAGKKKKHHDHAGHKGSHEEEAHGSRGAHFDEKKGHKKGHKTKGYHNKYHKDEFHKEHKFYDDYHKSGEHHRYGKFNAKHASNESGKKKAHHVNAGHDFVERGKKGYSNKGHVDDNHQGYNGKEGHEEHHQHHSDHGKKGGKEGGSQWAYKKH